MTESDGSTTIHHENDPHTKSTDLNKRTNFTRSPSLEKIIQLNTYICSQNYFILPAILTWLRSSQTVLKSYTEKSILTIKSAIFHSILYKMIESQFILTSAALREVSITEPQKLLSALNTVLTQIKTSIDNLPERFKRLILKVAVYFSFFYIFLQLALCLWALRCSVVPSGLTFLLACIAIVSYANYQCLRFIILEEELKQEERNSIPKSTHASRSYIRTKDILGKRTISHVSLF